MAGALPNPCWGASLSKGSSRVCSVNVLQFKFQWLLGSSLSQRFLCDFSASTKRCHLPLRYPGQSPEIMFGFSPNQHLVSRQGLCIPPLRTFSPTLAFSFRCHRLAWGSCDLCLASLESFLHISANSSSCPVLPCDRHAAPLVTVARPRLWACFPVAPQQGYQWHSCCLWCSCHCLRCFTFFCLYVDNTYSMSVYGHTQKRKQSSEVSVTCQGCPSNTFHVQLAVRVSGDTALPSSLDECWDECVHERLQKCMSVDVGVTDKC